MNSKVFRVLSGEDGSPFVEFDAAGETAREIVKTFAFKRPLCPVWKPELMSPIKRGGSPFSEFSASVLPGGSPVVFRKALEDPVIGQYLRSTGELLPFEVAHTEAWLFNCTRYAEVLHPHMTDRFAPVFLRAGLPADGFFRALGAEYPNVLFLVEPALGGFRKAFETKGMRGLAFIEQRIHEA